MAKIAGTRHDQTSAVIEQPGRYLLLAIIHQAAVDVSGRGQGLTPLKIRSARNFLQSPFYFELCDFLGIQPSIAHELSEAAGRNAVTPIRTFTAPQE